MFDQARDSWFSWTGSKWARRTSDDQPVITHPHITGTGTRVIEESGRRAIAELFERSFGKRESAGGGGH